MTFRPENFCSFLTLRIVMNFISIWGFTMFYFLLIMAGYWFIFFKFQRYDFTFIPYYSDDLASYRVYREVFWVMFGFVMLHCVVSLTHHSSSSWISPPSSSSSSIGKNPRPPPTAPNSPNLTMKKRKSSPRRPETTLPTI
jgi:hypothetical protein